MFHVIKLTRHYTTWGDLRQEDREIAFSSEDVLDTAIYRYDNSPNGYALGINYQSSQHLVTEDGDGKRLNFAEIFHLVEGQHAHDRVMDGREDPQVESAWVARKRAEQVA